MLVSRGRLRFNREVGVWIDQALKVPNLELLPLDPEVALIAASLSQSGGDPADHLILATALNRNAELVSADERIQSTGVVRVIW
jgi:PIN domain nuclease of toxin-antitoxin system